MPGNPSDSGVSVGFRSRQAFSGNLDASFELNHGGSGRTTVGLWSANQNSGLISAVLDTDDTNFLSLASGPNSTEWTYVGTPYMNRWITLRIQVVGSQVNFYADGALLKTWPVPVSLPPDAYYIFFGAGSVCWKSGPNDSSFRLVSATGTPTSLVLQPAWTRKTPPTSPPGRSGGAMTYHVAQRQVVLFGGWAGGSGALGDTWIWDGVDWAQRFVVGPSPRGGHATAYDEGRGEVLLFGSAAFPSIPDTWTWDGFNWLQRFPVTTPSSRSYPAMAYDSRRSEVVMFGGGSGTSLGFAETWTWRGNDWIQKTPSTTPSGREAAAMAFDEIRGEAVLFGGINATGYPTDTWVWNGTNWVFT